MSSRTGISPALAGSERASRATSAPAASRLWEVDAARTVAILMMVAYHIGWDIEFLAPQIGLDPFSGGWRALQIATGSSFLLLVGVGLAISHGRSRARGASFGQAYARHARRAATVIAAALLVSAATYLALGGDDYIRFGILHCIGASMLLAPIFLRLGPWAALAGVAAIAIGISIREVEVGTSWLIWLGLRPEGGGLGVDYYPLLPWFGPVLIGLAIGGLLYPRGARGPLTRRLATRPPLAIPAGSPGRHSLPIYLVHQPLLIPLVALALLAAGIELDLAGFR